MTEREKAKKAIKEAEEMCAKSDQKSIAINCAKAWLIEANEYFSDEWYNMAFENAEIAKTYIKMAM